MKPDLRGRGVSEPFRPTAAVVAAVALVVSATVVAGCTTGQSSPSKTTSNPPGITTTGIPPGITLPPIHLEHGGQIDGGVLAGSGTVTQLDCALSKGLLTVRDQLLWSDGTKLQVATEVYPATGRQQTISLTGSGASRNFVFVQGLVGGQNHDLVSSGGSIVIDPSPGSFQITVDAMLKDHTTKADEGTVIFKSSGDCST